MDVLLLAFLHAMGSDFIGLKKKPQKTKPPKPNTFLDLPFKLVLLMTSLFQSNCLRDLKKQLTKAKLAVGDRRQRRRRTWRGRNEGKI